MTLSNSKLINKAAITNGSFSGGVGLSQQESDRFIDYLVNQSRLKSLARVVRMNKATVKIDKVGLGTRILRPAVAVTDPGETVAISTSQIQLQAQEIIAIARVSDDALEDNIEGDQFVDHLLSMIAAQAGNELESAFMLGYGGVAAGSATHIDQLWQGWYHRARLGGHVVDANVGFADRYIAFEKLSKAVKALPTKYRTNMANLRMALAPDVILDYIDVLAGRETATGDAAIAGGAAAKYGQVSLVEIPLLPTDRPVTKGGTIGNSTLAGAEAVGQTVLTVASGTNFAAGDVIVISPNTAAEEVRTIASVATNDLTVTEALARNHASGDVVREVTADGTFGLMTDWQNLIVGIQRDIRIETDRLPRLRATDFVITMRADVQMENPDAAVLLENLKVR